ncbi:MAG: GNAT family N-acetyltransferase, partial [Alphaproteobacteria bacterium]|nr:GNAT family N-acetyltransferase [Alphaproteobacteria bacterium]
MRNNWEFFDVKSDRVHMISNVLNESFDKFYQESWSLAQIGDALSFPHTRLMVMCAHNILIGFGLYRVLLEECELLLFAIASTHRRSGCGRALLYELCHDAAKSGARSIFLEVRENNDARFFYNNFGFGQIGLRKNYYLDVSGGNWNALTLRININVD